MADNFQRCFFLFQTFINLVISKQRKLFSVLKGTVIHHFSLTGQMKSMLGFQYCFLMWLAIFFFLESKTLDSINTEMISYL